LTTARTRARLLLCLAVGPGEELGALELVEAARVYFDGSYRVVLVDDTGGRDLRALLRGYAETECLVNTPRNGFVHLLRSLQRAYLHALDRYEFEAILKVDTDSLIIGPGLDTDILQYLASHPEVGMVGAQSWPERVDDMWARRMSQHPTFWAPLIDRACKYGYVPGESVLGGGYALSRACLLQLRADGLLALEPPSEPRIAEDVTFSLLVRVVGREIHDFGGSRHPLALAWRGLPLPRQDLVRVGKKAIHSIKFTTDDLRARDYFARLRVHAVSRSRQSGFLSEAPRISRALRRQMRWAPLAERALRHRRPVIARPLLMWLVSRRPWSTWFWTLLVLSCLPKPLFEALVRGRRAAIGALRPASSISRDSRPRGPI
jgi:hypothetical protein